MAGHPADPEVVRDAVAAKVGASPADVLVEMPEAGVPGLTVFAAHFNRRSTAGLWDGTAIDLDPELGIQRVADAWGYGADRRVPATEVAEVIGLLEGHPGAAFLDQEAIDLGGDPATMHVPEEVEVDGAPAVRFWNSTARLSPYRCTFVVREGGKAEARRG